MMTILRIELFLNAKKKEACKFDKQEQQQALRLTPRNDTRDWEIRLLVTLEKRCASSQCSNDLLYVSRPQEYHHGALES